MAAGLRRYAAAAAGKAATPAKLAMRSRRVIQVRSCPPPVDDVRRVDLGDAAGTRLAHVDGELRLQDLQHALDAFLPERGHSADIPWPPSPQSRQRGASRRILPILR